MGMNTNKCAIAAAIALAISGNAWADAEVESLLLVLVSNVTASQLQHQLQPWTVTLLMTQVLVRYQKFL